MRLENYILEPNSGCHIWLGRITSNGRGQISFKNKLRLVTHLVWERDRGPIPKGKKILHHCDVPMCVNANHLFLGTQADNMADMRAKGRQCKGERKPSNVLSETQAIAIFHDSRSSRKIARDYGISKTVVCAIKNKRKWVYL